MILTDHSPTLKVVLLLVSCIALLRTAVVSGSADQVTVKLVNDSGETVAIHWLHPDTKESVYMSSVAPNLTFTVNSFLSHQFQILQVPDQESGLCGSSSSDAASGEEDNDETCKTDYFQVTQRSEQAFVIKKGVQLEQLEEIPIPKSNIVESVDLENVEEATNVLKDCKEKVISRLQSLQDAETSKEEILESLHDCVTRRLAPAFKASEDALEFERTLRIETSQAAENFTCVDINLETSPDVREEEWIAKDNVARHVHIKLDRPASRIHVVENFASEAECQAMEEEASSKLHVASTADGKGGTKISIARKAMQAAINPRFTPDGEAENGNLIAVLSGRVYEYVNHALKMNLTHHGQEPLMSIQYFGRGYNETEPDRYTPHCDGKCEGKEHVSGSRMATMVIYCTIPEKGGFTNFGNAYVHVKPTKGSAIFFGYIDPLTNMTDYGFTQHSGCPVYEGEKKIITQWVRYGVDAQTTHAAFNTLQILRSEDGE